MKIFVLRKSTKRKNILTLRNQGEWDTFHDHEKQKEVDIILKTKTRRKKKQETILTMLIIFSC